MKEFKGKVLFIDRSDVNTDEIIPAKYLTEITKEALKPYLLEDLTLSGFNREEDIKDKAVIVTRANFGCGSSREHAPWALEVNGINVVIAENFARIFRQNMYNCGMFAIELPKEKVDYLFDNYAGKDTQIDEKKALNGVNLTLEAGDFVTIIGGNGAGKSTMLNAIAGVWPVDSGKIIIDGVNVTKLSEHKRAIYLGRVFQDPMNGTAGDMEIEENLAIAYRRGKARGLRWGITAKEREWYKELLKTLDLGLETRLRAKVGLLSGGQRQALTLLMATLKKPKLLLLDEHTAALDPKTAAKVLELSDRVIAENSLTALMVTHNMKDAIVHGNRLIMMWDGRIILDIKGEEKKKLTVEDLLQKFSEASGSEFVNDRALLG